MLRANIIEKEQQQQKICVGTPCLYNNVNFKHSCPVLLVHAQLTVKQWIRTIQGPACMIQLEMTINIHEHQ